MTVSVGAALLLAEGLVRIVAPQQLILVRPDIWRPADTLGWEHRPGVDTRVNTGERTVRFVTDHRGFRVAPSGPAEGDLEVLLLGDSYMAALQVDYAQSFAGLLEAGLPETLGRSVVVRNAAVGAWDAAHYRIRARQLLDRREYDLVLVAVYLGNDLVEERAEAFEPRRPSERRTLRLPSRLAAEEMVDAVAHPVNDWLEVRSHLFVLAKNAMQSVLMRLGLTARYIPTELRLDHAGSPAWDVTADILSELHRDIRARGIPALFVLIPSHYQVEPDRLREHARALGIDPARLDAEQPNRLLGERLRRRGIPVVDLLPVFREAAEGGAELYGRIDPHFSPEGHRAMWRETREKVSAALPVPMPDGVRQASPPDPGPRTVSDSDPSRVGPYSDSRPREDAEPAGT